MTDARSARAAGENTRWPRPGTVFTEGEITLHTRLGHLLFFGRNKFNGGAGKPPIIGLQRFITNINSMCTQVHISDDPYADYYLLEIEQLLDDAREKLLETRKLLRELLDDGGDSGRVVVKSRGSDKPVTLPLRFKYTRYGFLASELLGLLDEVVQLALNASDTARLSPGDFRKILTESGRVVRRVFFESTRYRYFGAGRDDFAANNARARRAIEGHGFELPEDVLRGDRRPRWAPEPRKRADAGAGSGSENGAEEGLDALLEDDELTEAELAELEENGAA